ncbi:hypothetical protein X943_003236 [Babesia divergens]|uniref:Cytochrome c oxidase assembly factor 5 n=1 Tax=Babesia divergens TaxID=32595 RepID=A0AAD9LF66_BABDI|nr:hypothetical protein X943_003236 [Babesia divergens]
MALRLDPDLPHRHASNSCDAVKNDLIECYKESRCCKVLNRPFNECLNNLRPEDVGEECLQLRRALAQCRRNIFNGKYRVTGNPYSI